MRWILIANLGTPRCELYRSEFQAFWNGRASLEIVPWIEIVRNDGHLDRLEVFDGPACVRLESPGKNDTVTRALLQAGQRELGDAASQECETLAIPKGLLLRPGLQFRGFCRVLRGLHESFTARPHLKRSACPLAIAAMFDKTETCRRLHEANVPIPPWLENPADVFAELCESKARESYYLKLNSGSSAMGMARIVHDAQHERFVGITTVAEYEGQFWNTRRVRECSGNALERVAQFILDEGALAQQGIPLAQIDGTNFDVRVVCLRDSPVASIVRQSPHPMTNLHLGGKRGDLAAVRAKVPTRLWLDALDHCAEAAKCFDSTIAGVDLVFDRGFQSYAILEVNAFGDFFPGWTNSAGRSIHSLEFEEWRKCV